MRKGSHLTQDHKDRARKYYLENKEKLTASSRKYYQDNREQRKTYAKKYKHEHPEKAKIYDKKYRLKHKKEVKATHKKWVKENPEKVKAIYKKWYLENPEKVRERYFNRYSIGGVKKGTISKVINENMFKYGIITCEKCKEDCENDFHIDHIIPISKNGTNDYDNLQLLCAHCNCVKHTEIRDYRQVMEDGQMFLN